MPGRTEEEGYEYDEQNPGEDGVKKAGQPPSSEYTLRGVVMVFKFRDEQ